MSAHGMEMSLKGILREILSYKSGIIGLTLMLVLIGLSIYTIATIPYGDAIRLWRGEEGIWIENPRNAEPEWVTLIYHKNLPKTIKLDSRVKEFGIVKTLTQIEGTNMKRLYIELTFNYQYDDYPSEFNIFFYSKFNTSANHPLLKVYFVTPSGEKYELSDFIIRDLKDSLYVSVGENIEMNLRSYIVSKYGRKVPKTITTIKILFSKIDDNFFEGKPQLAKGMYKIIIEGIVFGKDSDVDARAIIYGKVYGIAGTDHLRRPLEIALLWGTPIALSFGLTASLITSILQLIIATVSGWYGGRVDSIIQRITEIYMILPFLPFLILISTFYRIDIWVLLTVVIVLSIFGSGVKSTRALVMQIKEYPYVEAAKAYGASDLRIIFFYIIPKILPPIVPGLISAVPGYVFLEAALSFLGLGDPFLPTWGKVINDAFTYGALYKGYYYWVLEPSMFLVLTALAFAFFGFALDKIVNPRLREM